MNKLGLTGFCTNTTATVHRNTGAYRKNTIVSNTIVPFGDGFLVYWLLNVIAEQFSVLSVG